MDAKQIQHLITKHTEQNLIEVILDSARHIEVTPTNDNVDFDHEHEMLTVKNDNWNILKKTLIEIPYAAIMSMEFMDPNSRLDDKL